MVRVSGWQPGECGHFRKSWLTPPPQMISLFLFEVVHCRGWCSLSLSQRNINAPHTSAGELMIMHGSTKAADKCVWLRWKRVWKRRSYLHRDNFISLKSRLHRRTRKELFSRFSFFLARLSALTLGCPPEWRPFLFSFFSFSLLCSSTKTFSLPQRRS